MSISSAFSRSLAPPSLASKSASRRASKWRFLSWLRTHAWSFLAAIILLVHAVPFVLKQHSEWDEVYLRAATRLLNGGDVYCFEDGYSYPPFMAWAAFPFTFLPPLVSRLAWLAINVVCLVGMWRLAWRMTGGGTLHGIEATDKREHLICFLGLACSLRYALNGIAHHQTDLVIGILLLGGCFLLSRQRDWSAGSCFGLAAAMKCTALLWTPYLLCRGKWKAAIWLLAVAVGVNLLPDLVRAPERGGLWIGEWLTRYVRPLTGADRYPGDWGSWIIYNQSISGAGNRWLTTKWGWGGSEFEVTRKEDAFSPTTVKAIVFGFEAALVIAVIMVLSHKKDSYSYSYSYSCSSLPCCSEVVQRRVGVGAGVGVGMGPSHARSPAGIDKGQEIRPAWSMEVLEYSAVLLLMVLLSPMSSKPHFATLVLPGFMLSRLAVLGNDRILRCTLGVAIIIATLSLPLWGGRFDFIALWFGSDTWNALVLLIGCLYALRKGNTATVLNPQSSIFYPQFSRMASF